MYTAVYQLSLVVGLGILAVLLLRGYSFMTALFRSGLVLIIVLFLFVVVANLIKISLYSKAGGKFELNLTAAPEEEPPQNRVAEGEGSKTEQLPEAMDENESSNE